MFYNYQISISSKICYTHCFRNFNKFPFLISPDLLMSFQDFVRPSFPPYILLGHSMYTGWIPIGMSIFCSCSLFQYYRIFSSPSLTLYPLPLAPSITEDAAVVVNVLYWPLNFFPKQSKLIYSLSQCMNSQSYIILYLVNTEFYLIFRCGNFNQSVDLLSCFICSVVHFYCSFHIRLGLVCIMNCLSSRLCGLTLAKHQEPTKVTHSPSSELGRGEKKLMKAS